MNVTWEQRMLGNFFVESKKYVNPKQSKNELWSLTVEEGLTKKTGRYNRSFLVKKEDKFKQVSHLNIVYNPMNITLGAIDLYTGEQNISVSGYYVVLRPLNEELVNYLSIWLKSQVANHLFKTFATGSLLEKQRVQYPTFSEIPIKIPEKQEANKIGFIIQRLAENITLNQYNQKSQSLTLNFSQENILN